MQVTSVDNILAEHGFSAPRLNALVPDQANYKTLLMQPEGHITADDRGVRNSDPEKAQLQFSAFLHTALETGADLTITPEYSLPWMVLEFQSFRGVAFRKRASRDSLRPGPGTGCISKTTGNRRCTWLMMNACAALHVLKIAIRIVVLSS